MRNNRLHSVDLARGLAVLFMICVHCLDFYCIEEQKETIYGRIVKFLGSPPAAPVFMFLMGLSSMYSTNRSTKDYLKRGTRFFFEGYVLNIIRGVLPMYIGKVLELQTYKEIPVEERSFLNPLLIIDILQFAGVAIVFMGIIRNYFMNKIFLTFISIIIVYASPYMWGFSCQNQVFDYIIGIFIGDKPLIGVIVNLFCFPFFPWFAFPLIGMIVGDVLIKSKNIDKDISLIASVGILLIVYGGYQTFIDPSYQINDYYHSRSGCMCSMIGFVLAWLFICHKITKLVPSRYFTLLYYWSQNVTTIYHIQWTAIVFSSIMFGVNQSSTSETVLITLFIISLSHILTVLWKKRQ